VSASSLEPDTAPVLILPSARAKSNLKTPASFARSLVVKTDPLVKAKPAQQLVHDLL
jgi:hypothetical protein